MKSGAFELVHFKVLYIGLRRGFLSGFSLKSTIFELSLFI